MDVLDLVCAAPLDPSVPIPLYRQLKDRILQVIAARAVDPEHPLPSEQELCRALGLSRGTVRRCFDELAREGRVVRRRGLGTFARWPDEGEDISTALNFSGQVRSAGGEPSSRLLELAAVSAREREARQLLVAEGTPLWQVVRVRMADGVPQQYVTAWVPQDLVPELSREQVEGTGSLYASIAASTGKLPARALEAYEACTLAAGEARALGLRSGAPALRCVRQTLDGEGLPFETSIILMPAALSRFVLDVSAEGVVYRRA